MPRPPGVSSAYCVGQGITATSFAGTKKKGVVRGRREVGGGRLPEAQECERLETVTAWPVPVVCIGTDCTTQCHATKMLVRYFMWKGSVPCSVTQFVTFSNNMRAGRQEGILQRGVASVQDSIRIKCGDPEPEGSVSSPLPESVGAKRCHHALGTSAMRLS